MQHKSEHHGIIDKAVLAAKKHKNTILITVAAVIVAAGALSYYAYNKEQKYQAQWGGLFSAELAYVGGEGGSLQSIEDFAAGPYAKTDAGAYAALVLGNAYFQTQDFTKAELNFKQAMDSGNKHLAALAEVSLVAVLLSGQHYQAAMDQAAAFEAKYPTHFALAQVKQQRALAQELAGQKEAAQASYKALAADYPNTYYAAFAQMRLEAK
jgi:predicted negative regulator of RcsB-dependent stress response